MSQLSTNETDMYETTISEDSFNDSQLNWILACEGHHSLIDFENATQIDNKIWNQFGLEEREYQRSVKHDFIFLVIFYFYLIFIVIGNGLVVFLVYRTKRLRTITNYYITSLCVSGKEYFYNFFLFSS